MSPRQPPLLRLGPLSNRIYLITRYRELDGLGRIEAIDKVDVTSQVGAVLEELAQRGLELTPVERPDALRAAEPADRP